MTAPGPFVRRHRVRFDEVDAAGIVYFARFFSLCHETLEEMLSELDGGYASLIMDRKLGLPAVHSEADFAAPLRFGDDVSITTVVERLGTSSCAMRFDFERVPGGDHVATVRHVVALSDLTAMRARPLPDDVRQLLERHRPTQ